MDIAVADIIQVAVLCRANLRDAYNLYHYRVAALGAGGMTYEELALAMKSAAEATYPNLLSENAELIGVTTKRLKPLPQSVAFNPGASNTPGVVTGDVMSRQTCGMITKQSQFSGPANRGRVYVPYPSETHNDADGNPLGAYVTLLGGLATAFLVPLSIVVGAKTCTIVPVIYSQETTLTTDVTKTQARPYWTTQRRRARTRPS